MTDADLILRTMAGTQLAFLAALLLLRSRDDPALRYAALLPVGLAAFMITSAPAAAGALGAWSVPLTLVCVANPVWFWLFAEASFDETFRPGARHALALAAMTAVGTAHEIAYAGDAPWPLDALFKGAILGCVALAVFAVAGGRRADLVEARRRGRVLFVVGVGAYAAIAVTLQIAFNGRLPAALVQANVAFLFGVAAILSAAVALHVGVDARSGSVPPSSPPSARARPAVNAQLVARIRAAMEMERRYRDESLTVASLAAALGTQEYQVRRAINGGLGYRNFNEFLHHYRLAEAETRLVREPHLPVLTIALDVGFGSIGPFNRAFRRRHGRTPTQYRAGSGIGDVSTGIGEPAPHG